jgi:glycosyltransferase involved in cell wall biosynthesis
MPVETHRASSMPGKPGDLAVSLLTGGQDRHYAYGLATVLAARGVRLEIVGSDEVDCPQFHDPPLITFLNLRGDQRRDAGLGEKVARLSRYYARLVRYAFTARPRLFHILWNNRLETVDRTLLMLYYRLLGKRIALTAHNANIAARDSHDSSLNRLTLRIQYRLAHHIFVHTDECKRTICGEFGVRRKAVTVIPYGINNAVPQTAMDSRAARTRLGIDPNDKCVLFFGAIAPYKGLDLLAEAFVEIAERDPAYRLVIAGKPKGGCEQYVEDIRRALAAHLTSGRVQARIDYVPDEEAEVYFKAADVLVLPYRSIFQSGILFFAYSFGLPVIASDIGPFKDEIREGVNGFLCAPHDPHAIAGALERYFHSTIYSNLEDNRRIVKDMAVAKNSWEPVGDITHAVYAGLSARA